MRGSVRAFAAILGVIAPGVLATYIAVQGHIRSGWNSTWMIGLPLVMTVIFYRRSTMWLAAWVGLIICSFCVVAVTAQLLGSGP